MGSEYTLRLATYNDVDTVISIVHERMAWMDEVGIQQWNVTKYDERYPREYYFRLVDKKELFVLEDSEGRILVAGALLHEDIRWPDPRNALYLHHFSSRVSAKGTGSIFLDMCEKYCKGLGYEYFCLDSDIKNQKLEHYYQTRGYVPVGNCQDGLYFGTLREKKL